MKRIAILFACVLLVLIAVPQALLATIIDLNDFQNPLLNASRDGNTVEIGRLISSGSDPNTSDSFNNTPLSIAAHFGQANAVQLPLTLGANIDGIKGQLTPLQCAVYSGHRDTATLLLNKNADPNLTDDYGIAPHTVAAREGDAAMAEALLRRCQSRTRRQQWMASTSRCSSVYGDFRRGSTCNGCCVAKT